VSLQDKLFEKKILRKLIFFWICGMSRFADKCAAANAMMAAWAQNNRQEYASFVSNEVRMVIPAYNLDVTGILELWSSHF
jgi:hypothetical protein